MVTKNHIPITISQPVMSAQNPQIGTIKTFIEEKGFGFITEENQINNDIFFHIHDCKNYKPQKYDVVSFEKKPSKKKEGSFEAKNIVFLEEETKEKAQINKSKADQLGGLKVLGKIQLPTENKEIEPAQTLQIPTENQTKYIGKVDWHNDSQGYGVMQHDTLGEVFFLSKSWQGPPIKKDMHLGFYAKPSTKKVGKYEAVSIWEDEETARMNTITIFLNGNDSERKSIFEKLNETEKTSILEIIKEKRKNLTNTEKYHLWKEGYLTYEDSWERIIHGFLNYSEERKTIFENLNETEKIAILQTVKEKASPKEKYQLWKEGYLNNEDAWEGIIYVFIDYSRERECIFEKLNETEKINILEVIKNEIVTPEQKYEFWEKGYLPYEDAWEGIIDKFLASRSFYSSYSLERKNIFEKLTETEKIAFSKSLSEKITKSEQKYEFWKEGYLTNEDAWEEIIYGFLNFKHSLKIDVFKKLSEIEKNNLLEIVRKNATTPKIKSHFWFWEKEYLNGEDVWEEIVKGFLSFPTDRDFIFKGLNETEKKHLIELVKSKVNKKYRKGLELEGYLLFEDFDEVVKSFINNHSYRIIRNSLMTETEKTIILKITKEKATPSQKYEFWQQGYLNNEDAWNGIFYGFLNYSSDRKNIFEKLNETEKTSLLEIVKGKATSSQKYSIWEDGYLTNQDAWKGIVYDFLNYYSRHRESIFQKLSETEKTTILEILKEKAKNLTDREKYEFWQQGYLNNEEAWGGIIDRFLDYSSDRKNIFEKLGETEKMAFSKSLSEKINNSEKKYEFWQEGYLNNEEAWGGIIDRFLNYYSDRKNIFEKLGETEKSNLLEIVKEKITTSEEKYKFWKGGYLNNEDAWEGIVYGFLNYSSERKNIFEKLNEIEKISLLEIAKEQATPSKKYQLWQEEYLTNEDAWEGIVYGFLISSNKKAFFEKFNESEKNNIWEIIKQKCIQQEKEYWEQLKNLDTEQKNHFLGLFSDMPEYNILFWLYGLIEIFDFKEYAPYYFILNSTHRRAFNKKAKQEMKQEMDASLLKKLESWQKISDEGNGITLYEISWRSIWFKDKQIRICMDSSEGVFTQYYYWEYAEENFNFLSEYISGRRVEKMLVYAKGDRIEKIQGLDRLEETIYKAHIEKQTKENGKFIGFRGEGMPRIPVNMLLRNVCLQYLNLLQIPNLEPVCVYEINSFDFDKSKHFDISVLYSILLPHDQVAVIWESQELEKSKATHIFKCGLSLYESIFEDIQSNIGMIVGIRSKLRSKDSENMQLQTSLAYFGNIDHDNMDFEVWRRNLHHLLPTLPTPPNYKGELQQEHT